MYSYKDALLMLFGFCLPFFFSWIFKRNSSTNRKIVDEVKRRAEENRLHKIRDHQLNIGNQVFNIISDWKEHFPILINKIENNGGKFSIIVGRKLERGTEVHLQLNLDFVGKFDKDCEGHIFYGPYGADMYFSVPSHIDVREQKWLSDLIWNRLERDFAVGVYRTT